MSTSWHSEGMTNRCGGSGEAELIGWGNNGSWGGAELIGQWKNRC